MLLLLLFFHNANKCLTLKDLFIPYYFTAVLSVVSTKKQTGQKTENNICESSVFSAALKQSPRGRLFGLVFYFH